ncbi:MAG: RNA-binding protein [Candidatus Saliniplasma sp.]
MAYKNQHRLKKKKLDEYSQRLNEYLGDSPFNPKSQVDIADSPNGKVLLMDKKPVAVFFDDEVFPTIDGLLKIDAYRSFVTVDMGAVRFVYNGADIMAPGIVDADKNIQEGDLVWVRDVEHKKPLAVGRAMTDGTTMIESDDGKVVKSLHHVGDGMYK